MEGKTEERHYTPYKYGYSLGNGKEYSENGYLVVYYNGERKEVNSNRVEFYQPYESGKLTKEEFNEIVKGTKGVTDIWGDFASEYYTPDVEEFHIGFECGVSITTSHGQHENKISWYPIVIGGKDRYSLLVEAEFHTKLKIDLDKFRVKYLDREDIESLGFECNTIATEEDFFIKDNIRLSYSYKEYFLVVCIGIAICFKGIIKNKSELKVLLKQLNISYG